MSLTYEDIVKYAATRCFNRAYISREELFSNTVFGMKDKHDAS
jgi:hypothetical protein